MASYGNSTLAQLMACCWEHQGITWTNVKFPLVMFRDIHLRAILQQVPKLQYLIMNLKIMILKLLPHLQGENELSRYHFEFQQIDGLKKDCSSSIANALEILQSSVCAYRRLPDDICCQYEGRNGTSCTRQTQYDKSTYNRPVIPRKIKEYARNYHSGATNKREPLKPINAKY